ncbi:MAG: Nif11-like leader peptide family natural product precursor [Polyangiaceae bacterium]|nr:Nif11-like leader peptide family natural product precursor [Polyangiaceae bacterium]
MSMESFVKFFEGHVLTNAELKARLDDAEGREAYIRLALAEGESAGFSFTREELIQVMDATEQTINPQLSDSQLDGVVGGTGGSSAPAPTVKIQQLPTLKGPPLKSPLTHPQTTVMCCW